MTCVYLSMYMYRYIGTMYIVHMYICTYIAPRTSTYVYVHMYKYANTVCVRRRQKASRPGRVCGFTCRDTRRSILYHCIFSVNITWDDVWEMWVNRPHETVTSWYLYGFRKGQFIRTMQMQNKLLCITMHLWRSSSLFADTTPPREKTRTLRLSLCCPALPLN